MDEAQNKGESIFSKENYFDKLLLLIPSSVYWKNLDGVYLGCNYAMLEMTGLQSLNDIIGKTDFDLPWKSSAEILRKNDLKVINSKKLENFEETGQLVDGVAVTVISNKMPLIDEGGHVVGIMGSSINITSIKKMQKQLAESKTREAHFKAMSSIGGMMAHELRTPLSAIAVNAQNLMKYLPTLIKAYREHSKTAPNIETIKKHSLDYLDHLAESIDQSARYASNTVNTILAGFHYAASELPPMEAIDVGATIQEALTEYPLNSKEKSLITFSSKESYKAMAVASIIIHVIHNLLKNALYVIKEVSKGEITINIESTQKSSLKIIFKDTGKGIPEDVKEHIFEPFYTTKGEETSIGLGLYFCKIALEKMGGSIECDSQMGEYTTFVIKLKGLPEG